MKAELIGVSENIVKVREVINHVASTGLNTVIYGENVLSAYQVCDHIIGLAGGEGKMVVIHGQKGTTPEVQRFEGCKMAIDENPGIELVAQQWSQQWSPDEGFQIAQNSCPFEFIQPNTRQAGESCRQ